MRKTPEPGSVGERLRAVREDARLRLEDAVPRLNAVSRQLFGPDGPAFNIGRVSKLELGVQRASLDDVAVYAALDPKRRGKLWIGWNEERDASFGADETLEDVSARTGIPVTGKRPTFGQPETKPATRVAGGRKGRKP